MTTKRGVRMYFRYFFGVLLNNFYICGAKLYKPMILRTLNLQLFLCLFFSNLFAEVLPDTLYSIQTVEHLYSTDPDLALVGMDSLRRRCEKEGYNDFSRQRLELLQCCAHLNKNEIRLGIYYASEALKHARQANDPGLELMALQMLCDGYDRQKDDVNLSYFANQLLKLAPKGGKSSDWYEAYALYYQACGVIRGGETDEGVRLLRIATDKVKKDKWNSELFSFEITDKLAELYKEEGNYEKSWHLLKVKLKELENSRPEDSAMDIVGLRMTMLRYHSRLMEVCQLMGKDTEAVYHYRQTCELYAIYPTLPETPLFLSRYLVHAGQYKQAETFLHSLLDQQRSTGDTLNDYSLQYLRLLAEVYTNQGCFKDANEMNRLAFIVSDTLQRRNDQKAVLELNALYRAEEYENIITRQQYIILYGRILLFILVGGILVWGIRRSIRKKSLQEKKEGTRPVLSPLSPEEAGKTDLIYKNIFQYVVTEQHYLDKDIDIAEVGRNCHMNKEIVNKVLTQKMNMTLLDFVNHYRLERARVLLLDPANKTIDVIAGESGFNTTRTFLRQFKAKYQMSPTEYRRQNG